VDHELWKRGREDTTAEPGQMVDIIHPALLKVRERGVWREDAVE
jgi:hypothetical protein